MTLQNKLLAYCIAMVACITAAHAGNARNAADKMCNAGKLGQSSAYVACLEGALKTAETELAAATTRARATINGGALKGADLKQTGDLFDAAQAHWLGYRNAECEAYEKYDTALGAGGPQMRLACQINETVERHRSISVRFSSE
jgi:uncharacterized protein YecT (DUF1311 family)